MFLCALDLCPPPFPPSFSPNRFWQRAACRASLLNRNTCQTSARCQRLPTQMSIDNRVSSMTQMPHAHSFSCLCLRACAYVSPAPSPFPRHGACIGKHTHHCPCRCAKWRKYGTAALVALGAALLSTSLSKPFQIRVKVKSTLSG